jgi:NADPH-dependent 2,4-dienoyl-CoA reductase/sulfur reductase-like enzyme
VVQRLVVIGGGAAGMSAASAARRVDPTAEIVVLEASGYAAYGMCGLPYYLSGEVEQAEDLLAYPAEYFRQKRGLDLRLRAEAKELDPNARVLSFVEDGVPAEISYDRLIVAAGGTPVVPPLPGLGHERVFTVRSLEDAKALRSLIDAGRIGRALIVGAGYIGLEMAEAFSARGVEVTVAEMLPRVMPNLDESLAALVEAEVRCRGVDLRLGCGLREMKADARGLVAVLDGAEVAVDVAVIAVGVRPTSGVALAAGAASIPGGGLLVDDHMRTSLPDVFAAGACIAPYHRVLRRPAFVPLGPAANKTGRVAGVVAAGGEASFKGIVGTAVVKVYDLAVARTGLTLAEAEAEGLAAKATDVVGKSRAKYYPGTSPVHVRLVHEDGGRILGAQMLGSDGVAKRIDVVATAIQAEFDVSDLAALDLSYAPPFAPVYEPILLAAQAAMPRPGRVATAAV